MEGMMIKLLNMSFAAGCTVLAVLLLRLLLRRLPKGYSYALWMIVLFRFLCPVVISSPVSLLPVNPEPMRPEIVYQEEPELETGVIWIDRAVNQTVGESLAVKSPENSINPIQVWLTAGSLVWCLGALLFGGYHLRQMFCLRRRLTTATAVDIESITENGKYMVRESDQIDGAFVMGVFRPVIYLPAGIDESNREYVLRHEMVHIRRRDDLIKLLGLLAVALHWFNPLAWIGFRMMCVDMEMSCDECVMKDAGRKERQEYSQVLLAETERRSGLLPLAFGKHSTYRRIRNILAYHKPGTILTVIAVIILTVAGVGLVTSPEKTGPQGEGQMGKNGDAETRETENRETESGDEENREITDKDESNKDAESVSIIGGADGPTSIFVAGKLGEGETWQTEEPDSQWLASVRIRSDSKQQNIGEDESEDYGSKVSLDFASESSLIFHGDFGLFSFEKDGDGRWTQQVFLPDAGMGEELAQALAQVLPEGRQTGKGEISYKDGFKMAESSRLGADSQNMDCDVFRMEDGQIGVLGVWSSGKGYGRLIDLYYGYYDPRKQEMRQAFLFIGDRQERSNPKGEISESYWLFARDDFDYYMRTPREALEFEKTEYGTRNLYHTPYGRMELARSGENKDELLDALMYMGWEERQGVVLTEDRFIYMGFEEATTLSIKRSLPVSICLDGSDRRVGAARYGETKGMCYADGYLYYEGWSNDGAFPRSLMRMRADFTKEEKIGELPGSLVTVRDGGVCLWMDWQEGWIMAAAIENLGNPEGYLRYLRDGQTGRRESCQIKKQENGQMQIILTDIQDPSKKEEFVIFAP